MTSHKKAQEERFDHLHNLLTEKLIQKLESPDVTHQEMMAAINWLKANGIDSPGQVGTPIDRLSSLLPNMDSFGNVPEFVTEYMNGTASRR